MKITCPGCAKEIPLNDVNPSTDVAFCRACGKTYSFAELSTDAADADADLTTPPPGTWVRELGGVFEVGSTTRSAIAFFLVPFVAIWSGGSLGGIYGTQFYKHRFDLMQSLFGIPFLLGSLFLIPVTLMAVFGKIIIRRTGDIGSVALGFGPFFYTRRFRWSEIKRIHATFARYRQNGQNVPIIELVNDSKPIRFGSQLSEPRRKFLLAILKRLHTSTR